MARMEFDENLVTQALDELNSAGTAVEGVAADMQAGFSTILGARGAEYLSVNTSICASLESSVEAILNDDVSTIKNKAAMIAEYSEAGFFKKLFYSSQMTGAKLREGFFEFVESGVDFIASGVGAVAGIFNSDFADAVGEFIETEHVDNWYAQQYKDGKYSNAEKFSWYSSESTAAKIFEGVGSAVGLTTVGIATGSLGGMAIASGASTWGKDMQANLQEGDSYYKALGKAALTGTVTAAITYGAGKVASNVFGGLGNPANGYAASHLKSGGVLAGIHNAVLVNGAAATATGIAGTATGGILSGEIFDKDVDDDTDVKKREKDTTPGEFESGTGAPITEAPTVAPTNPDTVAPTQTPTVPKPTGGGGGGGGGGGTPTTNAPTVAPTDPTKPSTTTPTTPTTPPTPTTPQTSAPQNPYIPSTGDDSNGGGFTEDDGFTGEDVELPDDGNSLGDSLTGANNYVNIPTSSTPINTTTTTGDRKSIIPVIAGLGAAAIAGIGTKSYLDKKEEENSEEEIETEEWTGDEQIDLGYTEDNLNGERDYLNPTDEFAYEDGPEESYEAVNSSELASMQ